MINKSLRKIAADLAREVAEPEINREAIYIAIRRIEMQAEMLEEGLAEPVQVSA